MTDIKMPGMNGLELLAEVRKAGAFHGGYHIEQL